MKDPCDIFFDDENNFITISTKTDFKDLFCHVEIDKYLMSANPKKLKIITTNTKYCYWDKLKVMEYINNNYEQL